MIYLKIEAVQYAFVILVAYEVCLIRYATLPAFAQGYNF